MGLGSWLLDLGSWVLGLGSWIWALGSWLLGLGSRPLGLGSGCCWPLGLLACLLAWLLLASWSVGLSVYGTVEGKTGAEPTAPVLPPTEGTEATVGNILAARAAQTIGAKLSKKTYVLRLGGFWVF